MPSDLERRLGGPLPPAVAQLDPPALALLDELFAEARKRQREDLVDSVDGTLKIVPAPLRPVIRRLAGTR